MSESPRFVLVAGATGCLGRHVVRGLRARGARVRMLSRRRAPGTIAMPADDGIEFARGDVLDPASLRGTCDGVDAVISCVGASLDLYAVRDRLSYTRVDAGGNLALVEAARAAGVRRFAYVSVFATPGIEETAYVRAHREVERALAAGFFDARIIRPTGFFGFLDEFVRMARRGVAPLVGDGSARTNPVDEADVAEFVADAFAGDEKLVEVGGPDVLSRAEIAGLAAAAVGKKVRVVRSSPAAWKAASRVLTRLQPRLSELLEFAAVVSTTEAIAPRRGRRRLEDHFREVARA
ncbi:MAG: SDR family oxidoreductase [Candidatus Binatia bacterium]